MSSAAPHDLDLHDVLERNARAFRERTAVVTENEEERSFGELLRRVDRLGSGLAAAGLAPGGRVAILAQNSAAFLELLLACARQGCVAYPLNWRLKPVEVARLLERGRPRVLVADAASAAALPEARECGAIDGWVCIDDDTRALAAAAPGRAWRPLAELYVGDAEVSPRPAVSADDPFAVIATAAVDVVPRGALLSHRNLVCSNVQEIASLRLGPDDRTLTALPLFHIAGLGHTLAFLHAGGACVVLPRFDAVAAVHRIDRHRVTHLSDFPPVLAQLLDVARAAGSRLATLRHVTGLDSPETMAQLHSETEATFWTGFGQCETTGFVTLQNARERLGCAGKPSELALVRLHDDDGREVPAGETGEIVVRGPLVFLGYDGQPDVTAHTFRGGWHHTGDLGRFDEDGSLFYVARKPEKELIKPGGENVYPAEVEAAISALDGVAACCVFGVPDPTWGEAVAAAVELRSGAPLDAQAIADGVAERIARYKKPKHVVFFEALPRRADGAVDRTAVKVQAVERMRQSADRIRQSADGS
jgi:acyl-CoA synthetase (AMP-forming)/AMP-acid ligase II